MDALQFVQNQLSREFFPSIINLSEQVHLSYWSDHYHIPKPLFDLLPFGRTLSPTTFYWYTDYRLPQIAEAASRTLLYWTLSGAVHSNGQPAEHINLFYEDTFFWHYYIPARRQTIIESI